jgi:hypothetical protein
MTLRMYAAASALLSNSPAISFVVVVFLFFFVRKRRKEEKERKRKERNCLSAHPHILMSTAEKEAMEKMFLGIGLDKKRAADSVRNEKLTAVLAGVVRAARLEAGGCDKAVGNLLYALATEYPPPPAPARHRDALAVLVAAQRIATRQQLLAAFKFVEGLPATGADTDKPLDVPALERACGIGVVVPREAVVAAVRRAIAACPPTATLGEVMKVLKADDSVRWADQAEIRKVVEELKP